MRNCPNCDEILGNNVKVCFRCGYDFQLKKMPTQEDLDNLAEVREEEEKKKREEEERRKRELEEENIRRREALSKNPIYEYRTEYLMDNTSGILNKRDLDEVLTRYANNGWRLHTMVVNEAGKNSTTVGIGGISSGTNATMDVTILVFERCVKAGEL